jgi:hypothetical protein
MAHSSAYLDRLRVVPAFEQCSQRTLVEIGRLVDEIDAPPGTTLPISDREVAIALEPTRVLVVERRALPALLELVPRLFDPPARSGTRTSDLRLLPTCSLSSA